MIGFSLIVYSKFLGFFDNWFKRFEFMWKFLQLGNTSTQSPYFFLLDNSLKCYLSFSRHIFHLKLWENKFHSLINAESIKNQPTCTINETQWNRYHKNCLHFTRTRFHTNTLQFVNYSLLSFTNFWPTDLRSRRRLT